MGLVFQCVCLVFKICQNYSHY